MHPKLVDEVTKMYGEIVNILSGRAICRFAYTLRTFKEQDDLYVLGRTKGGQSYHNYGLAFDIVLLVDKDKNGTFESASWETNVDFDGDGKSDWKEIVVIAKQYGWEWGGDWKFTDMPHFQKTLGHSVKQLNELYTNKKFIGNLNYVNI